MWDDFEMDPAFLERDALRKSGKPVKIARTERLLIRETILEDVPKLYELWQQPGAGDFLKPLQLTLKEELAFMEAYIRHAYTFYDYGLWTVLEQKSGQVIGRAGLFPSEILEDGVELGYLIGPKWQRQGYGTECGRAILSYAAEELDILKVHLLTDCRNLASVKTAEALGFREQGRVYQMPADWLHFIWEYEKRRVDDSKKP